MKKIWSSKKATILILFLSCFVLVYLFSLFYHVYSLKRYDDEYLPMSYIGEFDMTCYSFERSKEKLTFYQDYMLSQPVLIRINQKEESFTLKELGVSIDYDQTIEQVKEYQKKLDVFSKILAVNHPKKKEYRLQYQVDQDTLRSFLTEKKKELDVESVPGYFDMHDGVRYVSAVNGFSLDVEDSVSYISQVIRKGITEGLVIDKNIIEVAGNPEYEKIDTMTSSFVTTFMPNSYYRNINLNTALAYINGTVVEPGEVFSYCDKAGPFDKKGYVFYYEFVGNGVCQIATTTYNAALLGGLEIVKRYPHKKKSLYVDGGLDATVASYSSGWCVDMQFKNTYSYPILIKAYSVDDQAHVEFWSNHDAKGGYEYTTSSEKIGVRGYRSYLHTWKDGEEIDVKEIATTWYSEE